MTLLRRIGDNISDMAHFGPGVVLRHFSRLKNDRIANIDVKGVGRVFIRTGQSDIAALRQVFANLEYDISWPIAVGERIAARYAAILASGGQPIIVDAGANIGAASLWFGHKYPEAKIVAVEPHAGNAGILRRNVAQRENHVVLEAAIGSEPGFVALTDEGLGWAVQTHRADQGLPIVTIDDALAASGGDTPFIVKIDIEGFESDLFSRNLDWIAQAYMVIIEPHDWMLPGQQTSGSFQKAMATHPFELFMRGENLFYVRV